MDDTFYTSHGARLQIGESRKNGAPVITLVQRTRNVLLTPDDAVRLATDLLRAAEWVQGARLLSSDAEVQTTTQEGHHGREG